jgi:fructose-1,6-bisphosphatase II / sedoheptulose-1,7-bisphosphatase
MVIINLDVLSVIGESPKNDIYLGTGGGPEGVIAAAALSCYGGQIQGRLVLDKNESDRAIKLGIKDLKKKYNIDDMVQGDVIFCSSGVTSGELAKGIVILEDKFQVNTFALHKSQKIKKLVTNTYNK